MARRTNRRKSWKELSLRRVQVAFWPSGGGGRLAAGRQGKREEARIRDCLEPEAGFFASFTPLAKNTAGLNI